MRSEKIQFYHCRHFKSLLWPFKLARWRIILHDAKQQVLKILYSSVSLRAICSLSPKFPQTVLVNLSPTTSLSFSPTLFPSLSFPISFPLSLSLMFRDLFVSLQSTLCFFSCRSFRPSSFCFSSFYSNEQAMLSLPWSQSKNVKLWVLALTSREREGERHTERETHREREVERQRDRYQATYFLIENELKTGLNALFFCGFPK